MSAVCPAAGIGFMPIAPVFFSGCGEKMTKKELKKITLETTDAEGKVENEEVVML